MATIAALWARRLALLSLCAGAILFSVHVAMLIRKHLLDDDATDSNMKNSGNVTQP